MYTTKQFTTADIKQKNRVCPGTINEYGDTYIVTRYSVIAEEGVIPEPIKQADIAALGSEKLAYQYCKDQYSRDFDNESAVQFFYRVHRMEVE